MNTLNSIQEKVNNAKELNFGTIISESIELFKKVWLKGFLIVLILMVFTIGFVIILQFLGLGQEAYSFNQGFDYNDLLEMFTINALYSIPQTIIISSLTIALVGAFYRICKQQDLGESMKDDYFYFFKREYLGKIFLLGVIYTAIATVAQLMFFFPYIYVFVPLSYFSIIFANNPDLNEVEIVKASFSLGNKKWLITFGTMFVAGILGMLGVFACGIGLLFTMSIIYLPVFLIYRDVVGFNENSEIDKIGTE